MKTSLSLHLALIWGIASGISVAGETRFVNVNNANPSPPYTNWATAATVIQDAVDMALPGDEILVTNGVYENGGRAVYPGMTNRIAVTKPLAVRSVNGPDVTVIRGYQVPGTTNGDGAVRCVYLTNGATLVGFTLTNGAVSLTANVTAHEFMSGGGVWCESTNATVSNCVFAGNSAKWGGGAFCGTLDGCRLSLNVATAGGGGAVRSVLNRCVLTNNSAYHGGGAFNATLNQCTVAENGAGSGVSHCVLNSCAVSRHTGYAAFSSWLTNCLIVGNTGGAANSLLWNCTIVSNALGVYSDFWTSGSNIPPGGCDAVGCALAEDCLVICPHGSSSVANCIVYDNTANHVGFTGSGFMGGGYFFYGGYMDYSCTTPLPTNLVGNITGVGNITNAPLFVDAVAGNYSLQSNSPCINAGRNAYAPTGSDLGSQPRTVGGTVDIGAHEFQSPQSAISYAWLHQYGLPTDGSVDLADFDGDGHNNRQEWRAWTDPSNSLSVLRLLTPNAGTNGILIRWQSVSGQTYFLERSTNLGAPPAFAPFASNLVGQADTTVFTDTNAVGTGPLFYRVGVNE